MSSPVSKKFPLLRTLKGHCSGSYVTSVAFAPDGTLLASAADGDSAVRLWRATSGECVGTLEGHKRSVYSVAFNADGSRLATASGDRTIRVWDPRDFSCLNILRGHSHHVYSVAFAPHAPLLASGSWDNTVRIWRPFDNTSSAMLASHKSLVHSVAFSPDGKILATASVDRTIRLWDTKTRENVATLTGHTYGVHGVAFSPDGSTLASVSSDFTVRLWNVQDHTCLHVLEGHTDFVVGVAFSPCGRDLASASWDDTVRLWDVLDGTCISTLEGHKSKVSSVAFSPDGTILASGSFDNSIQLWGIASKSKYSNSSRESDSSSSLNPFNRTWTASADFLGGDHHSTIHFSLEELRKATDNFNPSNRLGKGGQGAVYRGRNLRGVDVAVKEMAKSSIAASAMAAELNVLCHVTHPHIVSLLGYCSDEDSSCLVYEYLPGKDLSDNLTSASVDGRALSPVDRFRIAKEVASALVYLREHKPNPIVHRDLKPQNIMLDEHGKAKIADWGLAKLISQHTASNQSLVGTWGYVAPEVASRLEISPSSDMYSFGVVLLQLLTGIANPRKVHTLADSERASQAFHESPASSIVHSLTAAAGPWPEDLAQRVVALGIACLSKNPRDRPSVDKVYRELTEVYEAAAAWSRTQAESKGKERRGGGGGAFADLNPYCMHYSMDELARATNNFNSQGRLGKGSQWAAFKGSLRGVDVVVKVMPNTPISADKGMAAELQVLGRVQHPHILALLGYSSDGDQSCLVYEYLPGKSLLENLVGCDSGSSQALSAVGRFRIAKEVASVLMFLRRHEPNPIVHRDLKPQNIMLDEHGKAKIADWGLAKTTSQVTAVHQTVVGASGYTAPEVIMQREFSPASDMYSFGVILVQLMTGIADATGIHSMLHPDSDSTSNSPVQAQVSSLVLVLDTAVATWPKDLAQRVLSLGISCMSMATRERPHADKVFEELSDVYSEALRWENASRPSPAQPDPFGNQGKRFEQAMDILETLNLDDEQYTDAMEVLEDPEILEKFLLMRGSARKMWLMRKVKGGASTTSGSNVCSSNRTSSP